MSTRIRHDRNLGPFAFSGAPVAGTNEIQTITFGGTPTGGTFRLRFRGARTEPIAWSATNATLVTNVQTALRALHTVNGENLTVAVGTMTSGIGTLTVTFNNDLGRAAVPTIAVADNSLTGTDPTLAVAETTPGVDATLRGAMPGALAVRTDDAIKVYVNTASAVAPTWTVIGAQTA